MERQAASATKTLGIALGGGVVRSIAHIGVLSVFIREGIRIDMMAGTSAASIIGTIYASGVPISTVRDIAVATTWRDMIAINWRHPCMGVFSSEHIEKFLQTHCRCALFEELPLPFAVVAADLMSGEERVFTSGPIAPAVRASCSIPGVFQPMRIGKRLYIDGCYVNQIPASAVRAMGAEFVIGCDVSKGAIAASKKIPRNMFTILQYLVALHSQKTANKGRHQSDVLISIKIDDIALTAMHRGEELIERGAEAAERALPQLRQMLQAVSPTTSPVSQRHEEC